MVSSLSDQMYLALSSRPLPLVNVPTVPDRGSGASIAI